MMRYVMKQKLFTIGEKFSIFDQDDQDVYHCRAKIFTLGNQLFFADARDQDIFFIKQKLLSWVSTHEIYQADNVYATIKKEPFTFFKSVFHVDVVGKEPLEIVGNFFQHEYTFSRSGRQIAEVSKQFFAFSDTYGIDIAPGEDDALILATVVVIDMVSHNNKGRSSGSGFSVNIGSGHRR